MPSNRTISLIALCIHYSALTIIMHISRTNSHQSYKASSAVVLTEFFKLLISICLGFIEKLQEFNRLEEGTKKSFGSDEGLGSVHGVHRRKVDCLLGVRDQLGLVGLKGKRKSEHQEERTSSGSGSGSDSSSSSSSSSHSITKTNHRDPSKSIKLPIKSSPTRNQSNGLNSNSNRMIEVMNQLKLEIFQPGWWKLSVPAIMFVLQNNLQYIAASNLSVPLFQITYQLKILTTALCSVLLLNRTLYKSQWIALFLLSVGVAAVQLHAQAEDHPPISSSSESSLPHVPKQMNQLLGLLSVLLACVSSGFASVYFERVLKSSPNRLTSTRHSSSPSSLINHTESSGALQPRMGSGGATSVWIRNIQLSFFGFLMGGLIVHIEHQRSTWEMRWDESTLWWWESYEESTPNIIKERPKMLQEFWNGFDWMVWCVIGFQVIGGLLNALVIKFSDNIAKGFATSVSILISFGLSLVLFEFKLSLGSLMGIGLVVFSTWFFNVSQDQLDRLGRKLNLKR